VGKRILVGEKEDKADHIYFRTNPASCSVYTQGPCWSGPIKCHREIKTIILKIPMCALIYLKTLLEKSFAYMSDTML
jgi:hypothetical protein